MHRGGGDQILAAHHVGDALQAVIDDDGEGVGDVAVAAAQHRIANLARELKAAVAEPAVGKGDGIVRQVQADGGIGWGEVGERLAAAVAGIDKAERAVMRAGVPLFAATAAGVEIRAQLRQRGVVIGEVF